jgi:hypothetical protein
LALTTKCCTHQSRSRLRIAIVFPRHTTFIDITYLIAEVGPSSTPSRNFHGPASGKSEDDAHLQRGTRRLSRVSCGESQHLNHVVQHKPQQQHLRSLRTRSTSPIIGVSAGLVKLTNSKPQDPALQYSAHALARSREVRHREDGSGFVGGGW